MISAFFLFSLKKSNLLLRDGLDTLWFVNKANYRGCAKRVGRVTVHRDTEVYTQPLEYGSTPH